MTGWRLGWAVLPNKEEASLFKQLNINTVSCVPPFIQEAAREALESPKTAEVVAGMVSEFKDGATTSSRRSTIFLVFAATSRWERSTYFPTWVGRRSR